MFSFFVNETLNLILKLISIAYLVIFIVLVFFRLPKEKVVTIKEKKTKMKNFAGSTYRKIFHRRECRFADSIKDQYLVESDDVDFFLKQKYKPCKICMSKNTDKSDLKKRK